MGRCRGEPRGSIRLTGARGYWWVAALVATLAIGAGPLWRASHAPSSGQATVSAPVSSVGAATPAVARRETRPTLDPARFVGKAARAHEVAREIPDVLDRLYCYCGCDKSIGHVSLLSCYTDSHAAT